MATTAGTLIASIARRVRDPNQTAHTAAFTRDILDRMQVVLNAKQNYVFATNTITATQGKTLYSVETDIPGAIEVVEVLSNGTELDETSWRNLHRVAATYLSDSGTTGFWAKIGKSLVVLYPAPNNPVSLTFKYVKYTAEITDDNIQLEVTEEGEDILRDMVTAVLLIRQRDLDTVPTLLQRTAMKLGLQVPEFKQREGEEVGE